MGVGDLPREITTAADDKIFSIYQDWVHQNIETHLDGGMKKMVSVSRGEKLVIMPTQHYDVPYSRIGNRFVRIVYVKIDRIQDRQWNVESVTIFQKVILQCVTVDSVERNIRARIDSQLDLWNKGDYGRGPDQDVTYNIIFWYVLKIVYLLYE